MVFELSLAMAQTTISVVYYNKNELFGEARFFIYLKMKLGLT